MRDIHFMPKAWIDLGWWLKNDIKTVKKIYSLLENTCKSPFEGFGHPEPLKANYSGYWSRRINSEHRIIYKVEDKELLFTRFMDIINEDDCSTMIFHSVLRNLYQK